MCSRKTIFLDLRRYCCYPTTTSVPQTTTNIAERFRFHKRHQLEGETVSAYLAELKTLSLHCEFGTNLGDSLRDRLVCGLNNALIQKRLLSERDLTLAKATQIALSMEAAAKDVMLIFWSMVFVKFNRWMFPRRSAIFKRTRTKILLYFHESKGKELQKHAFILNLSSYGNKNI